MSVELYPKVPRETLEQLKKDMANGVVESPEMRLVDQLEDDDGNKILGAFRRTEDGPGEILIDRALFEQAQAGDPDATALLLATYTEEQGHAVSSVLEQRLGIDDLRFDEGALIAREILADFAASGQNINFSLNLGLESVGFTTTAEAVNSVLGNRFTSARLLNDYQENGMEFAKLNADGTRLTVEAGDTLTAIVKAELGPDASEQEVMARMNEYVAVNAGLEPDALAIGQQLEIPELLVGSDRSNGLPTSSNTLTIASDQLAELGIESVNLSVPDNFVSGTLFPGVEVNDNGEVSIDHELVARAASGTEQGWGPESWNLFAGVTRNNDGIYDIDGLPLSLELANQMTQGIKATLDTVAPEVIIKNSEKVPGKVNISGAANIGLVGPNGGPVTTMNANNPRLAEAMGRPTLSNPQLFTKLNALGLGIALSGSSVDYYNDEISGAQYTGDVARTTAGFAAGAVAASVVIAATLPISAGALAVFGVGLAASIAGSIAYDFMAGDLTEKAGEGFAERYSESVDAYKENKTLTRRGWR